MRQTRHVFVSHSSRDAVAAEAFVSKVEQSGHACWFARRDVGPSENYQSAIVEAIDEAYVVLVLISTNANGFSSEIERELALASARQIAVLPVRLDDVLPNKALAYILSTRQWIDLFPEPDPAWPRIIAQLDKLRPEESVPPLYPPPWTPPPERPKTPPDRRRVIAAIALAFLAVGALALVLWPRPSPPPPSPARPPALALPDAPGELTTARVNGFRINVLVGGQVAGREWLRGDAGQWRELYPDGRFVLFRTIKRVILGDCSGTVVEDMMNPRNYAFIPDRGCPNMQFSISHDSPGWAPVSAMADVR